MFFSLENWKKKISGLCDRTQRNSYDDFNSKKQYVCVLVKVYVCVLIEGK